MRKFTAVALATASLLSLAAPAFAQDAADEGVSGDEEIVVQARRRDESIQDVPLSVQAVTGAELQKLEIRTFTDVAKAVPGLQLVQAGAGTTSSLRGISFDARASGSSTSVEFYRNDAVITSGALFQAVYDIGQVEVLRGPQGTLRGRASPSGSITVTTKRPNLSEPGAYVSGSFGTQSRWNFNAAVNVPVVSDKLAIRVAGFIGGNRGNEIKGLNVATGAIDSNIFDRTNALRASVRADPFDGVLTADFSFETIKNESRQYNQVQSLSTFNGGAASPRTITVADRLGVGSEASHDDRNYKLYNWQVKLRQWGQSLTYVGSKTSVDQTLFVQGDPAGLYPTLYPVTPITTSLIGNLGQLTGSGVSQTTHELRLQNEDRVAGLFDYVIGGFLVKGSSPTVLANTSPASVTVSGATPSYTLNSLSGRGTLRFRDDKESSLFGNLTVHLGENTELSGGIRHIWMKILSGTVSGITFVPPISAGSLIQQACFGRPDAGTVAFPCQPTKEATIYAASLKHKFSEDIMAYASFGTSWRPGNSLVGWGLQNVGVTLNYGPFINQFLNLPDETSKSYEIGIKTAFFDRRLKFNLSAFYQKFNNYALYGATAVQSLSQPTQAGATLLRPFNFAAPVNATTKGIEAELQFDVSPNFNFGATFAFADSSVKGARVPCVDTNNDNRQDSDPLNPTGTPAEVTRYNDWLAQIGTNQVDVCTIDASPSSQPRFSGTVQAEYTHPVNDFASAYLRGFVSWKGASANDAINLFDDVPAYALVDLFGGIRAENGGWEVGAYVKNLFDTKQVISRGSGVLTSPINAAGGSASYNYMSVSTTQPREVGITARFAIGSR